MKLEEIGFYTLSDKRVQESNANSPMQRCELVLTEKCNFKCLYCRGLRQDCKQDISFIQAKEIIDIWTKDKLKNIRFSGGEPTCYKELPQLIKYAKSKGVEHIAISTNGSMAFSYYKFLIECGVNDFSISLDACCSSFGKKMCGGIDGAWEKVIKNIKEISKLTYVTVGMVFTEDNINQAKKSVIFAHNLGVADIRVISSAQYNQTLERLINLPNYILQAHPILKYRINNFKKQRSVRGIQKQDYNKCPLAIDDSAVAGNFHFPCIIYMREHGQAVGVVNPNMRKERIEWFKKHNTHNDPICKKNCLDVCVDYNNKYREFHGEN